MYMSHDHDMPMEDKRIAVLRSVIQIQHTGQLVHLVLILSNLDRTYSEYEWSEEEVAKALQLLQADGRIKSYHAPIQNEDTVCYVLTPEGERFLLTLLF